MDQLNSCLDVLEQRNNSLNAELRQFLEANRQDKNETKDLNEKKSETN